MSAAGEVNLKHLAAEMAGLLDGPDGPGGGAIVLELLALLDEKDRQILLLSQGFPTTG